MPKQSDLEIARHVIDVEIQGLNQLADKIDEQFEKAVEVMLAAKGRIILTGVGKSGHVARKIAATMASTGTPAYYVHPSEASHGDLGMISSDDVVLALSKSGGSKEFGDIAAYTRRFSIPLISMTAIEESDLGKASDIILKLPDAPEACAATRAPTTSTTLQMALGDCLAVALLERRGFTADDFKVFHPGGKLGALLLKVTDLAHVGDEIPVIQAGLPMADALKTMGETGFGCLAIVTENGTLSAMLTDGDIRRALSIGITPEHADDIATKNPTTVTPDTPASTALRIMNDRKITQLFVVENGCPIGVVHMHDFLKAGLA